MGPGHITQMAFATRDLAATMRYYGDHLGVGPWFVLPPARFASATFPGRPCTAQVHVAFANANGMEIELVHQLDDTPSVWHGYLDGRAERERFHHTCLRTEAFENERARLLAGGYAEVMAGETTRGRFAYMSHPDSPETFLELLESTPSRRAMYAHVLLHAQRWNGADPVRPMPKL
jgi:Glyoxalase/Bleomycin resistance protein/Dioxygenase superfamily